jgi:hypothetical protein
VIHVDDRHVGMPLGQDLLGLLDAIRSANSEQAVIQGQLDEIDDERLFVEYERATSFVVSNTHQSCAPGSANDHR